MFILDFSNIIPGLTLYLCRLQKLMQFWMVSLLEVSLAPERVGGSPLSLKQPKLPGTVERREETAHQLQKTVSMLLLLTFTFPVQMLGHNQTATTFSP